MHSGIGDSSALSALGIKPLHHLPSVGANLSDHVVLGLSWLVNSNNTWETAARNATLSEQEFNQWNTTRTGPLVDNGVSHIAWLRIPDSSPILGSSDPPASPHFELLVSNGFVGPTPPSGNYMTISLAMVAPLSRK
jgi:choline dehydrogenase-like flavoprotein